MKKIFLKHNTLIVAAILALGFLSHPLQAQRKKLDYTLYTLKIVDKDKKPIKNAKVTRLINAGSDKVSDQVYHTNRRGIVHLDGEPGFQYVIEAEGKKKLIHHVSAFIDYNKLVLRDRVKEQEIELDDLLSFTNISSARMTENVNYHSFKHSYSLDVALALKGKEPSLLIEQLNGDLAWNQASMTIRGLSTTGDNQAAVFIDGVPRSIYNLNVEEIESVKVLKGSKAKILYGPRAINGIISITTKTPEISKGRIYASYEQGVQMPTFTANYLGSDEYAKLYNEARANDGLTPYYSESAIQAYQSSDNSLRYPNNDYQDLIFNEHSAFQKAYLNFSKGGSKTRYFVSLGYTGQEGLTNVGPENRLDRINVRGNLGAKLSKSINLLAKINVRTDLLSSGTVSGDKLFGLLSTHRPNEYPIFVNTEDVNGITANGYGVSRLYTQNIYAELNDKGYQKEQRIIGQSMLTLDYDLSKFSKGLSAKTSVAVDTHNMVNYGQNKKYNAYTLGFSDDGEISYQQRQRETELSNQSRNSDAVFRNYNLRASLNYKKSIAKKSKLLLEGFFNYNREEFKTSRQEPKQLILAFLSTLNLKNKYIFEGTISDFATNRISDNPHQLNYAASASWILSEERFVPDVFKYLRLKASYGLVSTDMSFGNHLLNQNVWSSNGSVDFGKNNNNSHQVYQLAQYGVSNLTWEKQEEYEFNLEGSLGKSFSFEMSYFNHHRFDILNLINNRYLNASQVDSYANYGVVNNHGVELALNLKKHINHFHYEIGLGGMYSQSELVAGNEFNNVIGYPVNSILGLQANGLFQSAQEIENHYTQHYGTVQAGDIKYQDLNGDGKINEYDQEIIGDSFPDFLLNTTLKLNYKRFSLFAEVSGIFGRDVILNDSYHWVDGVQKYSEQVNDRWTPENTAASYPRLTSKSAENNHQNSSFWVRNGDYLKLSNFFLRYRLPLKKVSDNQLREMSIWMKGNNLLIFSELDGIDPESTSAGISNFPLMKSVSIGLNLTI
ncbi:SusC/RagA family TonB-linked outer membrane protein [Sediminitomix flava]|uniref:TonB-linked SusC/RagA family outer membrane protein n=1 Tax=Sediminitomix flava TaxID=379075 RepID=A0A315ZB38_SEDFL|nr:SusC/RagA family TonB-linked outer membrane protein [Sediminitomix flava]PWJ41934.1 TonB-linked SusC/RagA family outer membrane protein [Sediminitomix flava]